jgi:hypothetical protein
MLALACAGLLALALTAQAHDSGKRSRSTGPVAAVDLRPPTRLPAVPAGATRPTPEGATAFALYWFDVLNYSLAHGDTEALVHVTGAGCRQCSGWLIAIAKWKAAGAQLEGGLTAPLSLAIGPFDAASPVQFAATYLTTPATVTDAAGHSTSYPGGRTRGGLSVLWSHDRWQMTDVVLDVRAQGVQP